MIEPRREQAAEETEPRQLMSAEFSRMAHSVVAPLTGIPAPAVIPAKAGIQETGPRRLIGAGFGRMAHSVVVPSFVIPALREWII